ncbi:MAG: tetratricopeptide repeat protein [Candidatus Cloacimonetes bacterium]|nr:tetratricopeptide repeat protein [Candidatus Cloacimonadota bacterium]
MKITDLEKKLANLNNDDKGKIELLNKLSKASLKISPEKAIKYANRALQLSTKIGDKKENANSLSNIGSIYRILCNYNKALHFYQKALKLYEIIMDKKELAECLNNIGIINRKLSNYDIALEYYFKSLKFEEEIEDEKGIAISLNNIGIIYYELGNYDKALIFYQKSLKTMQVINAQKGISRLLNNIGVIYKKQRKFDKALEYISKSLEIKREMKDKDGIAGSLNNIGLIHYEFGNFDKALEYSLESLRIKEQIGDKNGIASSFNNIGNLHLKLKNYNKAFTYLEQGLQLAREINAKDLIEESYEVFSDLYVAKEDYKKALEYYKLYSEIKDIIYNEESSNKIAEMQTKYETEKKEREAEIFRLKNVELEEKVLIRTEELRRSNIQLQNEIIEHKKAEEQIKKDLEEKKILLRELFHRTKNNMQIISSMLKMQSQYSESEFIHSTFKTINNRIKAMSLVQQKLYQSKELSFINLKEYIEDILVQIRHSYSIQAKNISLKLNLKEVFVLIDSAVPLGLILNELISNVYQHAFPNDRKGEINISLNKDEYETIDIVIEDNGIGFLSNFEPKKSNTIGFHTVFSLIEYQLDGEINCTTKDGVKWHIKFKDNQYEKRV